MKRTTKKKLSCELPESRRKTHGLLKENRTFICRYRGGGNWKGVKKQEYKKSGDEWSGIVRRNLIGCRGETTKFHVRYFEIGSGGYSSFESHRHEHVVIGIRGKGVCRVGRKKYVLSLLDTVYIAPSDPHQLQNPFEEPFGFLCIVNAKRDAPKILRGTEKR
jgi:quercetin dioxygenase-like cupin family protein